MPMQGSWCGSGCLYVFLSRETAAQWAWGMNLRRSLKDYFAAQGFIIQGSTPEAFKAFVASEVEKWTPIVKNSGAQVNWAGAAGAAPSEIADLRVQSSTDHNRRSIWQSRRDGYSCLPGGIPRTCLSSVG